MKKRILAMVSVLILMLTIPAYAVQSRAPAVLPSLSFSGTKATCEVLVTADNYMDDISLQTVAEAMNYSDAYFCKIFKQCFDKNFIVYLSEYRVARAKELLGDVLINVKDVSQKVGYRDSNYFAKVFKRIAGVTPTEYRMQVLKEAGER